MPEQIPHHSLFKHDMTYPMDIWTLKVHDSEQRFAFWFQIWNAASAEGPEQTVFSVSYFNALNPAKENRTLTQRFLPAQCSFSFSEEKGLLFESDSIVMTEHNTSGIISTFHESLKWSLNWYADPDSSFSYFASDQMYRYSHPPVKLVTPNPLLRIEGKISVGDLEIDLQETPGIQSHVWGDTFPGTFVWLQCNAFEETDFAEIEALTFTPFRRSIINPELSVLRMNLYQEQYIFNTLGDMFRLNAQHDKHMYILAAESDTQRIQLQVRLEDEFLAFQTISDSELAYTGIAGLQVIVSEKVGDSWSVTQKLTSLSGADLLFSV